MPRKIPFYNVAAAFGPTEAEAERKKFYNSKRWRALRDSFLRANPLCGRCQAAGLVVAASVVHHKQERLQRPDLAFQRPNLEALCGPCHTRLHKAADGPAAEFKKTLALDFNGVIHDHLNSAGGRDYTDPADPEIPGAIAYLKRASEVFIIAILSARFARPGPAGSTAISDARTWLIGKGIDPGWITVEPDRSGRIFLSGCRVPCLVCIDDRSIRFNGTFPAPEILADFRPWNAE